MGVELSAPKRVGARRLRCIPLAMLRDPGETLEGDRILEESPGEFGLLLWRTARDVTLWGGTPPEQRAKLFAEGSAEARLGLLTLTDIPPAVSAAVDTLHGMLASSRADDEIVAVCCLEIGAWAHHAGLPHTAVAFAQAGAVASPAFGAAALQVGVFARAAGQGARAETWLRRAVSVSRRERDRVPYAVALVELGELYESRDSVEQAERLYQWGFRAARRYASRSARMRAAHGLFRLMRRKGDEAGAAQFAVVAQGLYEPAAAGGPDLLLDLARYWTEQGKPARARGALRRLAPSLAGLSPATQLAAQALTARARAEIGNHLKGASAVRAAWLLMADQEIADEVRFEAARHLAHAARVAGDLVKFTRARHAVLRLAPQADFPAVSSEMAALWPDGGRPCMERAS